MSVCRTEDRASLQHLVFNMQNSDFLKFDNVVRHNSTMDSRTREALYSKIRCQIARNFDLANKNKLMPVCRYCRVEVGSLNEYVAFVTVDNYSIESEIVSPPPCVPGSSSNPERNVLIGITRSEDRQSDKAVDDHVEMNSQSRKVLGTIEECQSGKKMRHSC